MSKYCSKCGVEKTDENTSRRSGKLSHLYRSECKNCNAKDTKQYLEEHPGKQHELNINYYNAHREEQQARVRQYYNEHKEERREHTRNWYKAHREHRLNYNREYDAKKLPTRLAKVNLYKKRHRHLKRGAEGSFTNEEWLELIKSQDYKCLHCGKREPEIQLTIDHIIPLSRGGSNFISNIQGLCKPCNSSKGNR